MKLSRNGFETFIVVSFTKTLLARYKYTFYQQLFFVKNNIYK